MKYRFVAVIITVLGLSACQKSKNTTAANADFKVKVNNVYLSQAAHFEASDPSVGTSYNWNYGDGVAETAGATIEHAFKTAGTFTVTLSVNGVTTSQKVRVYPGNISYQVKNLSKQVISLQSYIDLASNGSLVSSGLPSGAISDTLFATTDVTGNLLHIAAISGTVKGKPFILYQNAWIKGAQNNIVTLADTSKVFVNNSTTTAALGSL